MATPAHAGSSPLSPRDVLRKYWGYDAFRPCQEEIINSVLEGNDTLGLLPTGGGKSLTFQVPAMLLPGITVVVTPLISLMKDQADNLLDRGIRAVYIHSGLSLAEHRLAMDRCRLGKTKLLYVSPEKLRSESFIDAFRLMNISLIVVDEAHCISQWGYDFRPSYLEIARTRELFPSVPVLALTASATPRVVDDITASLRFRPGHRKFSLSFSRSNLSYIVRNTDYKEGMLSRILTSVPGCAIVYVRSRRRSREIADILNRQGISASFYHAGLSPEDKNQRQSDWKSDKVRVMVATNAFGMGIDKPDVRIVIHFDLPSSLEEYYQEAGRAGRDGLPSLAVLLVSPHDPATLRRRVSDSFPDKDFIRRVYDLAGAFLGIPLGEGFNHVYDFNFSLFCTRFKLPPKLVHNALMIITQAGHILFNEEVASKARLMMLCTKAELYNLHLDRESERVLNAVLRTYTGIFADYEPIDEEHIAHLLDYTRPTVYNALLTLSRLHVIHYIPRRTTPFIFFTASRQEGRHIIIPRTVYEDRRLQMEQRVEAMRRFATDDTCCRAVTLLRYFGEENPRDCGQCDVCRARRKASPEGKAADELTDAFIRESIIYQVSQPGGRSVSDVLAHLDNIPPARLLPIIRRLISEETIHLSDTDTLTSTPNPNLL